MLTDTEKDNFVDHYFVITAMSVDYFSTNISYWNNAQSCSTASVVPAGRQLLAQLRVQAQEHMLWEFPAVF